MRLHLSSFPLAVSLLSVARAVSNEGQTHLQPAASEDTAKENMPSNEELAREISELRKMVQKQGKLLVQQQEVLQQQEATIGHLSSQREAVDVVYPFLASLTELTLPLPGDSYILWDNVLFNPDGVYDTETGGYVATVSGFYTFTVQLNVEFGDVATFFLTVNDVITTGTTEYDPDGLYFSTATSTVVLELQEGDVVQVLLGNDALVWGASETEGLFSWFTGYLLQENTA